LKFDAKSKLDMF